MPTALVLILPVRLRTTWTQPRLPNEQCCAPYGTTTAGLMAIETTLAVTRSSGHALPHAFPRFTQDGLGPGWTVPINSRRSAAWRGLTTNGESVPGDFQRVRGSSP